MDDSRSNLHVSIPHVEALHHGHKDSGNDVQIVVRVTGVPPWVDGHHGNVMSVVRIQDECRMKSTSWAGQSAAQYLGA